jgi:hypothetical protein
MFWSVAANVKGKLPSRQKTKNTQKIFCLKQVFSKMPTPLAALKAFKAFL